MTGQVRGVQLLNGTSAGYANSQIVSAAPATLYGISGYNSGPDQFIQLHDTTGVPVEGAVPALIIKVTAASNYSADFGFYGRRFANGVTACNSTTGPTKTIGAANCSFDGRFLP